MIGRVGNGGIRCQSEPVHRWLALLGIVVAAGCGTGDVSSTANTTAAEIPSGSTAPATTETAEDPPTTTAVATPATIPGTAAPTTTPTTTPPSGEFTPVEPGPYGVGVATVTLADPDRALTVDVWFPIDPAAATDLPPQQYTLIPGVYYESPTAVAAGVDLVADDGPFPLVVYSHGSGGQRYIHSSFTEAMAGHGYVVVAPDHTGNTLLEELLGTGGSIEEIATLRPTDVGRVIDAFVDPSDEAAGEWAAHVDAEKIAVTGHSFGGFTAVAMVTGLDTGDIVLEPDDRVDAIIALAPATQPPLLADDRIDDVDVPMLVLVGTDDATTPVDPNVTRLWDLNDNSPAYRGELVAGEHFTFTDLCAYQRTLPALDSVPDFVLGALDSYVERGGCSPGDIDDVRAAQITNTYAVAFLDQVLRGGDGITFGPPDDLLFDSR